MGDGDRLAEALDTVRLRFGDQALLHGRRLPPAEPWSTGLGEVDRLTGIRGLPRGRVSVLQGPAGSGKLTIGLFLLARASRELAQAVVIDAAPSGQSSSRLEFDPWALAPMGPHLESLTVVRPPDQGAAGEAATALARAGTGFLFLLGDLPEPALAPLEAAAARSGCIVLAVASRREPALAHASSLTLAVERSAWIRERGELVGLQARVTCVKNKLAAPGAATELEVRYPLGARLFPERPLSVRVLEPIEAAWPARTAAG